MKPAYFVLVALALFFSARMVRDVAGYAATPDRPVTTETTTPNASNSDARNSSTVDAKQRRRVPEVSGAETQSTFRSIADEELLSFDLLDLTTDAKTESPAPRETTDAIPSAVAQPHYSEREAAADGGPAAPADLLPEPARGGPGRSEHQLQLQL